MNRHRIGRRGERAALWRLRLGGWRVLGRNVRVGADEIDLVMVHPRKQVVSIVEVKSSGDRDRVMHRVTPGQQRRLARAAERLPRTWTTGRRLRFDVVEVRVGRWFCRVRHAPGAFDDSRQLSGTTRGS